MDCREFLHRYSDYDDSLISPSEADRFRAHMAGCPACERYDRVLRKGRMIARQVEPPQPRADFVPRLRARLWRESQQRDRRSLRGPARVAAAMAATTVLLAVAVAVGLLGPVAAGVPAALGMETYLPPAVKAAPATVPAQSAVVLAASRPGQGYDGPAFRPASLPPIGGPDPRDWMAKRVDRGAASSYSPLITGPPAYGGAAVRPGASIPMHRTLD